MKTVLILEDDLGFVSWLGQTLAEGGYQPLPAKSVPDAIALLEELHVSLDVLIVNPLLPGAAELIESVRDSNEYLRVVGLIDDEREDEPALAGVHAWRSKPHHVDERTKSEWLEAVGGLFWRHGAGGNGA